MKFLTRPIPQVLIIALLFGVVDGYDNGFWHGALVALILGLALTAAALLMLAAERYGAHLGRRDREKADK